MFLLLTYVMIYSGCRIWHCRTVSIQTAWSRQVFVIFSKSKQNTGLLWFMS